MDQSSKLPILDDANGSTVEKDAPKEEAKEDEENCRTPTSSESKLVGSDNPLKLCCPNAPKKQRSNYATVINRCKRRLSDFDLISLETEELEKAFGPRRREFQPDNSKKRKFNSC